MISLDTIQVDLTPLYTRINDVNIRVLDLDENVNSIKGDITALSSQLSNIQLNNFNLQNTMNISGIDESLNGLHDTSFKFNCINCSDVVSNFNSLTNVSGSVYGDGLCFNNCFNNNDGTCNFVLSPESLSSCFNSNAHLNANIEAYDLSKCLNSNSFGSLILDVRNLKSCLNDMSAEANDQYYIKADLLSSVLYRFNPFKTIRMHVDAMSNNKVFNTCSISHFTGYFNGDIASSCFNSWEMPSIITATTELHLTNRSFFLNYRDMSECFIFHTVAGDCAIYGNVLRMNNCFNTMTLDAYSSQYYSNHVNANYVKDCFTSMHIKNYNLFNNSFNSVTNIFNRIICYDYYLNANLNIGEGINMFVNITDALFRVKLNALAISNCFAYITHTNTAADSGIEIGGYVASLYSCFNFGNNINRLSLSLNGNICSDVFALRSSTITSAYYKNIRVNLDYNSIEKCFVNLANTTTQMTGFIDIKGGSVYDCFKNFSMTSGICRLNGQYCYGCCNVASINAVYCDGDEYTTCLNSNVSIPSLYLNVNRMTGCLKSTISMANINGICEIMGDCFKTGSLSYVNLNVKSIINCFNKLKCTELHLDCTSLYNCLSSCSFTKLDVKGNYSASSHIKSNVISNFDLNGDKQLYIANCIDHNLMTSCGIHCPIAFGPSAFDGNTIQSTLLFDYPPEFKGTELWNSMGFGPSLYLEIPNIFWVGYSTSISSVGIKMNGSVPSFVWQAGGTVSEMQKYCSNYTSLISDVCTDTNKKLVLKNFVNL